MFWAGRKAAFPAAGRISPDYYCMDGTIPRKELPKVLKGMRDMSEKYGLRVANVFHAGDGNLHPLILYDANKPGELEKAEDFGADILRLCVEVGGVLTGEHGVGVEKRDLMPDMFNETDLDTQMRVKCAFDPEHLLNPGKVFPQLRRCAELGRMHVQRRETGVCGYSEVLMGLLAITAVRSEAPLTACPSPQGGGVQERALESPSPLWGRGRGVGGRLAPNFGRAPMTPETVQQSIQTALENQTPLEILGHGSKRRIGPPIATNSILDLSTLTGITPLRTRRTRPLSAGRNPHRRDRIPARKAKASSSPSSRWTTARCSAAQAGRGTIGGVLATNSSGPRRLKAGAARDHILGVEAVSGRGELFKSGGRVMKNVTGYDLSKGLAGSWGTLAVLTKVTFKVLPAAETEQTLVLRGLDDAQAAAAMALAMGSNAEVSSAAHLPETVAGKVIAGALSGPASTLLRIEGFPASVAYRAEKLAALLKGKTDILPEPDSRALWREIRDVMPFADGTERPVWRVSAAPMSGHAMVADFRLTCRRRRLLRLAGRADLDPHARAIRRRRRCAR